MAYWDALEQRQSLRNPFFASLGFHVSLTAVFIGAAWWHGTRDLMGSSDSAPGAATVTTVDALPFEVRSSRVNRVANETESQVPQDPKPVTKPQEREEPDAVPIGRLKKKKDDKKRKEVVQKRLYQPDRVYTPNQAFSTTGARAYTPMFTPSAGGGGVGVGTSPFGNRFGAYADLIKQRIAEKWRSQDLNASLNNLTVVVTFDIQRNGKVTGIRVLRGANYAMDNSAMRAIQEASPLPPLPPEFDRNIANVEFHFKLQR
jgi:protein TonB